MLNYEVTITSPLLDGPLVLELVGSSPERAINRARLAAMHMYREPDMLTAEATAVVLSAV